MLNSWILFGIICCSALLIGDSNGYGGDIGPGVWTVHHMKNVTARCSSRCHVEFKELLLFKFDVTKKKINRTHDYYSAKFTLDQKYTDEYGILVDICRQVDGGCKRSQMFSDKSSVHFMKQYAPNNVRACLELAGIEPADFPIEKGDYEIKEYVFDYSELPRSGVYGYFIAKCNLLNGIEEVSCLELHTEFKRENDCDDGDCDDDDDDEE